MMYLACMNEERLAAALRWLHKENRQVIISTCHKREMEILDKERIPYQKLTYVSFCRKISA